MNRVSPYERLRRSELVLRETRGLTYVEYRLDPEQCGHWSDTEKVELVSGGDHPFGYLVRGCTVKIYTD